MGNSSSTATDTKATATAGATQGGGGAAASAPAPSSTPATGTTASAPAPSSAPDGRVCGCALPALPSFLDFVGSASVPFTSLTTKFTAIGAIKDGRILTGTDNGCVKVWDLTSKSGCRELAAENSQAEVTAVLDIGTLNRVASSHSDGTINIWDVKAGTLIKALKHPLDKNVLSLCLMAEKHLVSGSGCKGGLTSDDRAILREWDLTTYMCLEKYVYAPPPGAKAYNIETADRIFMHKNTIISATIEGDPPTLAVWDTTTRACAGAMTYHPAVVKKSQVALFGGIAFFKDGERIAVAYTPSSSRENPRVVAWNLPVPGGPAPTAETLHEQHTSPIHDIVSLPDGRIVTAGVDDFLIVYDHHKAGDVAAKCTKIPTGGKQHQTLRMALLPGTPLKVAVAGFKDDSGTTCIVKVFDIPPM